LSLRQAPPASGKFHRDRVPTRAPGWRGAELAQRLCGAQAGTMVPGSWCLGRPRRTCPPPGGASSQARPASGNFELEPGQPEAASLQYPPAWALSRRSCAPRPDACGCARRLLIGRFCAVRRGSYLRSCHRPWSTRQAHPGWFSVQNRYGGSDRSPPGRHGDSLGAAGGRRGRER
jgi:hypothetical protein